MFKVLPIRDRELFLRYAIPCGEVLVKRGDLRKDLLFRMNDSVKNGGELEYPIEDVFKVASRMCTILAKQMGRKEIDSEVIRRYFLVEHDRAIAWRKQVKPDIDLKECSVKPGKVLRIDPESVLVQTRMGEKAYRNDFVRGLKVNDWVSVHYDYIDEKLKRHHVNKMLAGRR